MKAKKFSWPLAAFAVLGLAFAPGCGQPPTGQTSSAPLKKGPRVASLAPSVTEIVCALGAADQLVGRSTACDYPTNILDTVPVVGEFGIPSMERLLDLKPDIVFYTDLADQTIPRRIHAAGINPVPVQCSEVDDVPTAIRQVGQCIGRTTEAAVLADSIHARLSEYKARQTTIRQRPTVLLLIWNDPLTAVGRKSFLNEIITLAGGSNVAGDVMRDYFPVSSEWVITRDPDVIFCFYMSSGMAARDSILQRSGWQGLKAVQEGRVYDGMDNNLILRPGPRMINGIEAIESRLRKGNDKP